MRAFLLCLVLFSGCAFTAATLAVTGVIAYGEMKVEKSLAYTDYRASVKDVYDAVLEELKRYKVEPSSKKYEPKYATLTVNGKDGTIEMHPTDSSYTRFTVDVGFFAQDETLRKLRKFFNDIGERLGQEATVPEYPGAEQDGSRAATGAGGSAVDDRAMEK